ncbi:hypothetical protein CRENBAI_020441 [Crenichthys baileyi]|uniref:Uncharacterized protein n=1 Tax=Crenichthys baileyi TaxID=28760 RepID=A0AAV9RQN1_9TELE
MPAVGTMCLPLERLANGTHSTASHTLWHPPEDVGLSPAWPWLKPVALTGWLSLGQTGEIVNVRNLVPPCLKVRGVTESGVEKQGQGYSCPAYIHTIWMESDTADS